MIVIKTPLELDAMRRVNRMTARVRDELASMVRPGITTLDLGNAAFELIRKLGGISAFYGYHGFPGQICVSVNEEVVHGIPGCRVIKGVILSALIRVSPLMASSATPQSLCRPAKLMMKKRNCSK